MARRGEQRTKGEAPATRVSSDARCVSEAAGHLAAPHGLHTRLLLHVPEVWGEAKRRQQVRSVQHTRRVTVRRTPACLSRALPEQSSPGSP
jgi:hypothetical protein